jgi:hypothetical protein
MQSERGGARWLPLQAASTRHQERLCSMLDYCSEWVNESEKGFGMVMLPPGKQSAGTCRYAWRVGSSSWHTYVGDAVTVRASNRQSRAIATRSDDHKAEQEESTSSEKGKIITSSARPCGGWGRRSHRHPIDLLHHLVLLHRSDPCPSGSTVTGGLCTCVCIIVGREIIKKIFVRIFLKKFEGSS